MTQTFTPIVNLYDRDYLLWTEEIVSKLRAKDFDRLDIDNLIEEIESLGRSEKEKLKSRLKTLLEHLLKRTYIDMPQEFNGWERTIREQRNRLTWLLEACPSLKNMWHETFNVAWRFALKDVRDEYQSKGFDCPDTWQFSRDISAILNVKFWEL